MIRPEPNKSHTDGKNQIEHCFFGQENASSYKRVETRSTITSSGHNISQTGLWLIAFKTPTVYGWTVRITAKRFSCISGSLSDLFVSEPFLESYTESDTARP